VAGCGGADGPTVPTSTIIDAAEKTTAAGPLRQSMDVRMEYRGKKLHAGSMEGAADGTRDVAKYTFDLTPLAELTDDVDPGELKGQFFTEGERNWVTGPAVVRELDPPKRWVLLSDQQIVDSPGLSGNQAGAGTLDPAKPVDHLRAAEGRAEQLGKERLDGVATTRYRVDVDYERYVTMAPADDRPGLETAVEQFEKQFGGSTWPIEVWIGTDGAIRRLAGTIGRKGASITYRLDITGVGEPADLSPPPRRAVVDARGQ
jgi:hypothetical protein